MKRSIAVLLFMFFGHIESYSQDVYTDSIYAVVDSMAVFPGGESEMFKFISQNIKYPGTAKENNIQGSVFARFVIEKDGSVSNVSILKGIGKLCDNEVVRVISQFPK
ncbi:TonB family protein [Cytophagaceae bacterium AH-315-L13]|nr:TonB family protein [Cytophagaceae bacterium AH-315-L13]